MCGGGSAVLLGDCYVTCGVLGEGGFGRVLIVKQRATGRVLALKIMRKRALASGGPLAVEQALREREVLIKLARQPHPFIVRLHHAFQDVANLYLAMDYIGGGDIFDLLQRYGGWRSALCHMAIALQRCAAPQPTWRQRCCAARHMAARSTGGPLAA